MDYTLINIKTNMSRDVSKGGLSVLETGKDIPFEIKRVFCTHGVAAGEERGFHAHKNLTQILFCPYGAIRIMLDDGKETTEVLLDEPSVGIVVEPRFWHTMKWEKDGSILCSLASDYYDESDYLRKYSDFLDYYKIER